jgi:hypothetical protein
MISKSVPPDAFSQTLYNHVLAHLHPTILAHSFRVHLYAEALAKVDLSPIPQLHPTTGPEIFFNTDRDDNIDPPLLFAACMFHDMGTCDSHDHDQRFEVCGADAAVAYMSGKRDIAGQRQVWEAIALHTSPGIAERMSLLTRVVRMAVKIDFGSEQYRSLLGDGFVEKTEASFPRGEVEKVLGDCVAVQAERRQGDRRTIKAPAVSWPWNLLRSRMENPGWEGVNEDSSVKKSATTVHRLRIAQVFSMNSSIVHSSSYKAVGS